MTTSPSRSRFSFLGELIIVLAVLVGSKLVFDQIIWKFAGPLSLLCTLAAILVFTKINRESWAGFGLRRLPGWKSWALLAPQALLGIVVIIGLGAGTAFAGDALGLWTTGETMGGVEDRWGNIVGNLPVYLLWLAIAWISAGFGEEVFFRGYMINRVEALLPHAKWALPLAVFIPAIGFGVAHMYYQGFRGLVVTGMIGLAIGTLYILYKRNIWPLIIAHGAVDTLGFTAMYLDLDV
jgi:membrane protease YdiL (CAAX protease family)